VVTGTRRPTLEIYVSPGCAGCPRAIVLADALRQHRPEQPVQVIDLADYQGPLPTGVIGTPTYRLGGEIISMGNPIWEELLARVDNDGS
jgi:alkyl hydroperoxide reductase subunit AhpF